MTYSSSIFQALPKLLHMQSGVRFVVFNIGGCCITKTMQILLNALGVLIRVFVHLHHVLARDWVSSAQ